MVYNLSMKIITRPISMLHYVCRRMFTEPFMIRSACLAYLTLLSLVPFVVVFIFLLSFVPGMHHTGKQLMIFVIDHFVASSAAVIYEYIQRFVDHAAYLSLPSLGVFLFSALLMLRNVSSAFNDVWHTHAQRQWWSRWLIHLALLFVSPFLLTIGFIITGRLSTLALFGHQSLVHLIDRHWLWIVYCLINTFCFTLLNWLLPGVKVPFRSALVSGTVTAILFGLAKWVFGLYIKHFSLYDTIYGALSVIPVFLIWIYLCWLIILFGALFGHFIAQD